MNVAIYVRVSTEEQAQEGYSIRAQLNRLEAYAKSQDWTIVKKYIDEGQSAKDMNRTDLKKMLRDLEKGLFNCVLVYRLDRLTRSVLDLYKMLKIFENHNVKFKSATEVYDTTTAMGRLFITLVAALAQWERENLGERVRFGLNQKAKEGKWAINIAPFGYDRDGDYLIVNESESTIVKKIFELYLTGKYGIGKIAKELNNKGLKTKSGSKWNFSSIHYVLTNPIYIGTMRFNYRVNKERYFEVENAATAIIDKKDFDTVQRMLRDRSNDHPRRATSPYIFTTPLRCARCGGKVSGHYSISKRNGKKYVSYNYYCLNRKFGNCDLPGIAQNYLEIRFLEFIKQMNIDNQLVNGIINDTKNHSTDISERIKNIKKELASIEKRRTKWQYAWANEMITDDDFKTRIDEENKKELNLQQQLDTLVESEKGNINNEILIDTLNNIEKNWDKLDTHEKKQFVNLIVKTITVDKTSERRKPESIVIDVEFI